MASLANAQGASAGAQESWGDHQQVVLEMPETTPQVVTPTQQDASPSKSSNKSKKSKKSKKYDSDSSSDEDSPSKAAKKAEKAERKRDSPNVMDKVKNYMASAAAKKKKKKEEAELELGEVEVKPSNQFIEMDYVDLVTHLQQEVVNAGKDQQWQADWVSLTKTIPQFVAISMEDQMSVIGQEYDAYDPSRQRTHESKRVEKLRETGAAGRTHMMARLRHLLATSGFQEVPSAWLAEAKAKEGSLKLDVHIPAQDEVTVHVYYRVMEEVEGMVRSWKHCFSKVPQTEKKLGQVIMIYEYHKFEEDKPAQCMDMVKWVAVNKWERAALGPKGSQGKIFIRVYNNVPMQDMDILWPGASPNFKILDKLLIIIPFLIGMGSAIYKIWENASRKNNEMSDKTDLTVFLTLIVLPFSVAFKAYQKALKKYTKYQMKHAQILVNSTAATDKGGIMQLLAEGAAQEAKEYLVAYTMLALADKPLPPAEVGARANAFLKKADPENDVEFDLDDALEDLASSGVLTQAQGEGTVSVKDARSAKRALFMDVTEEIY